MFGIRVAVTSTLAGMAIAFRTARQMFPPELLGRLRCSGAASASSPTPKDDLVERVTVISANVTVRQGASSVTAVKHYRVEDVHDKYYNKWFMSKVPSKKLKKDSNSS